MEEHKHETSDVLIAPVAKFLLVFFVSLAAVLGLMWWLAGYFSTHQPAPAAPVSPLATTPQEAPPPRLQVSPAQDLKAMREAEDAVLNSYGWVDRKSGIVRIPIDRAMDLLVERQTQRRPKP